MVQLPDKNSLSLEVFDVSALNYQEGYSDAIDYTMNLLEDIIYKWEDEVDKELLSDLKELVGELYKAKKD